MTAVDFEPLALPVPLSEDPPGVFRIGRSRVLLELVLRAYQRGESAEGIVRSYRSLQLADVYAVIGRYLSNPAPFDAYLQQCDADADEVRSRMDMTGGVSANELRARARAKGLIP